MWNVLLSGNALCPNVVAQRNRVVNTAELVKSIAVYSRPYSSPLINGWRKSRFHSLIFGRIFPLFDIVAGNVLRPSRNRPWRRTRPSTHRGTNGHGRRRRLHRHRNSPGLRRSHADRRPRRHPQFCRRRIHLFHRHHGARRTCIRSSCRRIVRHLWRTVSKYPFAGFLARAGYWIGMALNLGACDRLISTILRRPPHILYHGVISNTTPSPVLPP